MNTNDRSRWRGIAELVGLAGVIGSLVFVGMQLQQERELARISDFAAFSENNIGFGGLIAENRDVWVQGLNGDELSPSDRMVFETMARILYRSQMLNYIRSLTLRERDPQEIVNRYAFHMYQYPGLRSAFENHAKHSRYRNKAFGQEQEQESSFRQLLRDALIGLETRSAPLPPRDYIFF